MKLYNTLTRSLQDFEPLAPPKVGLYVCGPTVYDDPHIGHARSAYVFDALRRYLTYKKYDVTFVRNVTDVDDKIITRARELGEPPEALAARYLASYHETMDRLGIERPDVEPKATEHIDAMLDLISKLVLDGTAYEAQGDVYFSVRKFAAYGKLSNRTLDDLKAGARVEPGEHKQDPLDFALWKAAKPGEPSWKSPWGPGRPGWHIECSAMSTKYLGGAFDIHGGGVDLVFPHHENEVAQAQAAGKPFAKYWIHNGLLTVNGEKMSKSLGNFITVEQALEACHGDARILKLFFLGTHYRSPIDYTQESLKSAAGRWGRWYSFLFQAETQRSSARLPKESPSETVRFKKAFEDAMDDDLNTPGALAALDQLVSLGYAWWKELEAAPGDPAMLRGKVVAVVDVFRELGKILELEWGPLPQLTSEDAELLKQREAARKRKDFQTADRLRQELAKRGVFVEDTVHGPVAITKRPGSG